MPQMVDFSDEICLPPGVSYWQKRRERGLEPAGSPGSTTLIGHAVIKIVSSTKPHGIPSCLRSGLFVPSLYVAHSSIDHQENTARKKSSDQTRKRTDQRTCKPR